MKKIVTRWLCKLELIKLELELHFQSLVYIIQLIYFVSQWEYSLYNKVGLNKN